MRFSAGWVIALAAVGGIVAVAVVREEAPTEAPRAEGPAAEAARGVAGTLADLIERNFVFPQTAQRYAARIRSRAAAGAYDGLSRERLAAVMTADLQSVAPDGHLGVMARWPAPMDPPPAGAPPAIEEARWLAPGIAYLRPTVFSGSADEVAAVRRFLAEHGSARTLIVDMRVNGGGGLEEMDEIFSAVFARPTRLAVLEMRAGASPVPFRAGPRLRAVAAPAGTTRLEHWAVPGAGGGEMRGAQLFVLTSRATVSAGEHFCFVLKHSGRASLIGARTVGAGNYGGLLHIGEGMAAFVPVGRSFDPGTGEGWEGVGVSPDVAVPASQALVEALVRAGVARDEARRISDRVKAGRRRWPPDD